ncbi:MAG: hypothetical protein O6941_02390 [Planctomycetota bacterium]|nr:hypothetical protein [Planctomycetota bacterium]
MRLATNSLLLYLECEPGKLEGGYIVWFEPTWHVVGPQGVLAGSRQAQEDEELGRINEKLAAALEGRGIRAIEIESPSNDLVMELEGDYIARIFLSDPTDDEIWHVADNRRRLTLYASPCGFSIHNNGGLRS